MELKATDLLERHAPRLHFDALERSRPSLVDDYLRLSTFLDEADAVVPGSPPALDAISSHHEQLESRLNPLKEDLGPKTQVRSNAMLREYGGWQDLAGAGICYGRVYTKDARTLFLQYWLFYVDNPCVLPPGRHDGDWELVQIRLRSNGEGFESTHVTVAGHGKPATRKLEPGEERPSVFVAVDSHASYLKAGAHPSLPLSDVCVPDSSGQVPLVEPLPPDEMAPAWITWRGRWGMNPGVGTWLALWAGRDRAPALLRGFKIGAGESPPSPARQGSSWEKPQIFQALGTGRRRSIGAIQWLAHFIGRLTWPRLLPEVRVERVGPGSFTIAAKPAGFLAHRVTMVSVAFEEMGTKGARRALAMYSVRTGKPAGPFEIPHEGPVRWRAAGYNFLRQRGDPGPEVICPRFGPDAPDEVERAPREL
jgi:hypothetical protein